MMNAEQAAKPPGSWRQMVAFARSSEPRTRMSSRAVVTDILIAAAFAVMFVASSHDGSRPGLILAIVMCGPLAARRRFPLTVFMFTLVVTIGARGKPSEVAFLAVILAGYSAAMHSRFRGAALLTLAPAGVLVAAFFWDAGAGQTVGINAFSREIYKIQPASGVQVLQAAGAGPARLGGLLVLVSLVSIAVVGAVMYAGDRIRRMQAEHESATRRAIEAERARIAAELHDVVTHNVSVMIVQAGAARQVLNESPARARNALLAVEASGRAAMTELRHLLGLLSPAPADASVAPAAEELRPQPGLQQLPSLVDGVSAAGLPVEVQVSERRYDLPPGLDLAAFRVVQEALTNVLKHAGQTPTSVRIDYGDTELVVDVADTGRARPAPGPAIPPGAGRGLIGLRERISLYGGELDAKPRPGGGWRVRARFPVDPAMVGLRAACATEEAALDHAPLVAEHR